MRIDRYIASSRIIDLKSKDLPTAYAELLATFAPTLGRGTSRKAILAELLERESSLSSYLGEGVALPHARVKMKRPYALAVGRCPAGLSFDGKETYEEVRFVFLLLASEQAKNYLSFLAALARSFQDKAVMDPLWMARELSEFKKAVKAAFAGADDRPARRRTKFNKLLTDEAAKIAKAAECSTVLVFSDVFPPALAPRLSFTGFKVVIAGDDVSDDDRALHRADAALPVRALSRSRLSQLRAAILLGLTRGIFGFEDRVCCIGGIPGSGQLDTVLVVDVKEEFDTVIAQDEAMLPADVSPAALERLIAVSTELASTGREGRAVGAMFVLGDHEAVKKRVKPLVLNPFHGYDEEDRSVLNPFMDETLKELALLDGAFVVRGDGVVESAGSLIQARSDGVDLPSGLGSRHAAAAAVTHVTDSLALVVSSSGQVSLFRRGHMFTLFDKSEGRSL